MTPLLQAILQDGDVPNEVLIDAIRDTYPEWPGGEKMAIVYVVRGDSGSHSDSGCWDVAGFLDEGAANDFRDTLLAWCVENGVSQRDYYERNDPAGESLSNRHYPTLSCPLDPQFDCEYNGVDYEVFPVPLRG